MSLVEGVVIVVAGVVAGVANAVAGGGSLVLFPALMWSGMPALGANVTNTVSLWPGYLGGAWGYHEQLAEQRRRLLPLVAVAAMGAAVGSALLLTAPEEAFDVVVPFLVLASVLLLAAQPRITARTLRPTAGQDHGHCPAVDAPGEPVVARAGVLYAATFGAAVYGGYFGGGLGVILLAVFGILLPESLARANGMKNAMSLTVNTVALVAFGVFGPVSWTTAALVAPASLLGGVMGARVARVIPPVVLRRLVVAWGTLVAIVLFAT